MPRKNKGIFSAGLSVARVKEDTRVSQRQDSLTDVMRRTAMLNSTPVQNPFEQLLFQEAMFGSLFNRYAYNDYYDDGFDEDDEEEDGSWYHSATSSPLPPHPNLRQLTEEESDKYIKEQEQRLERKRQKKLRRKERKRLEKEQEKKEKEERLSELEQNQASGSQSEHISNNTSKEPSEPSDGEESLDRDSQDLEELLQAEAVRTFINPPRRGRSNSPGTALRKGRGGKKTKNAVSREGSRPATGASPVISQTPAQPEDPSADKKENINGSAQDYTHVSAELAAFGHRLASCKQYEQAVMYFTEAIKYNPKEFKLFGNRSFCYERLQRFGPALQDADLALSLRPGWVKGLFRRGKALCGLKLYYDASLTYNNILQQDGFSEEAATELKRAQTLHLMEMGFSCAEACEALREHGSLEEALEALFIGGTGPEEASRGETVTLRVEEQQQQEEVEEEKVEQDGGWCSVGPKRSRPYQARRETRSASPRPASPRPASTPRWDGFSVWVGSLAPTLTKPTLHTLFSRAGNVISVKMLVEQKCAFINYTRMEDCDRAIQLMDGFVVEGTSLAVRYPNRFLNDMSQGSNPAPAYSSNRKECFFWRTSGCTKAESCGYRHVPEHEHIDQHKLRP